MKRFFKSMMTSLLIGLPLAAVFCVWMFLNKQDPQIPIQPDEITVNISEFEEENDTSKVILEDTLEETSAVIEENAAIEETKHTVTLSFAGDVHFSELVLQNYDKNGISSIVDDKMLAHMENADLFILNHEFVFSNRGEAMVDKQYTLRTDPKYVKILQELGTDAVSIANNHILDFGQDAFLDTLDTLESAEIPYIGGGRNKQTALEPYTIDIHGQSFAFLAATRVSPSYDWYANSKRPGIIQTYDPAEFNKAIEDADSKYDHIIVFVHWGIERNEYPEEYQRTLAKGYIDAGADLVVGAHPHVLQGFEYYKDVPIIYSLGNYLFGNRTGDTLLLNAIFDENGQLSIELIPCARSNGVLKPIEQPEKLFNHLTDISFDASVSHGGTLLK